MIRIDVDGKRRKGRLKRMWMDSVNVDLRDCRAKRLKTGLCGGNLTDTSTHIDVKRCGGRRTTRSNLQPNVLPVFLCPLSSRRFLSGCRSEP